MTDFENMLRKVIAKCSTEEDANRKEIERLSARNAKLRKVRVEAQTHLALVVQAVPKRRTEPVSDMVEEVAR